ncbi:peptidoglycan DD-metalloendopeptidase family protein [Agromyces sp. NPDC057679]|uniref:peptidoglycan DD-metalloendopeptidase family protein n=1 Tax=Agromyces sp. NPDC057679 TaxID=3346207 RepID=UPI00366AC7D2
MLRTRRVRTLGITTLLVACIATGVISAPAQASPYPSWSDVEAAKSNTAAAAAKVAELEKVLADLQAKADIAKAHADEAAEVVTAAQDELDKATVRSEGLDAQSKTAQKEADDAANGAAQIAAQQYRGSQGADTTVQLWAADADSAENLLAGLGRMEKISELSVSILEKASETSRASKSLTDQAKVAEKERKKLQEAAQKKFDEAAAIQAEADRLVAEQEAQSEKLEAQLAFLKDTEAKTAADYEAGVAAAEEARRRAAEEEERRRQEGQNNGGGGGSNPPASSGWSKPAYGPNTDGYGPRPIICGSDGCSSGFHRGFDIGSGCDAPVYAANGGTVVWAGGLGTYGNFVKIDHGGGIMTGYAHNRWGGLLVDVGQQVSSGQQVAWSGTTGASTGCHVHFEVFEWGSRIDPYPFMGARGVWLG